MPPTPLSPDQIGQALRHQPKPQNGHSDRFVYDPAIYDEVISGLFGRRWYPDEEPLPPRSAEIWSSLFSPVIGRPLLLDEVELVLCVVKASQSDALRGRAIDALREYLRDCTVTSDSTLKPTVLETLKSLGIPISQPKPMPKD